MFVYFINVPMNEKGIEEFESYDEIMSNVKTFELTEGEYMALRVKGGLFAKFDKKFGTIIDVCEEERIDYEDIETAVDITNNHKPKNEIERGAIEVIKESLGLALNAHTFWEIDIYLE